ncbi:MAG TPA: metal-dependent hydrolase [Pyrinomonadaceae bacterium]|jgi:membrane-bound metal-dependent hydrolase YbcI (DUF457 family)|nr:metal-dependent hydrolase [Pyrinomonadaceae bacterium]
MPLPFAHGLLGASIVAASYPKPDAARYRRALLAGAILANCADLDFVLVWLLHSRSWHRAFTHSFFFALLVGLSILLLLGAARVRESIAYGLAFASHSVLDYLTTKAGGGLELFWPVSVERLKLGLLGLSEVPSKLSQGEILKAVLLELMLFAPLLLTVVLLRRRVSDNVS